MKILFDSGAPPGQILLIGEGPITCNKDFHPPYFRRSQKFTVLEFAPSHVSGGDNLVPRAEAGEVRS